MRNEVRKIAGKLIVNVGSMFSGKSSELLRQGRRYELAGKSVVYVKPALDNRYSQEEIVTHDGRKVRAISVPDSAIHENPLIKEADVILIDEAQFFERDLLASINWLLYQGKDVIVSGLDMDRFGQPFSIVMAYLVCVADEVNKFHAVCVECGQDAWVSAGRESIGNDQVINLGAEELYYPVCRTCFYEMKTKTIKGIRHNDSKKCCGACRVDSR